MQCRKCHAQIPDESKYCLRCGARQDVTRKPKSRGNGQGSVYQRPNKTWIAVRTVGYYTDADGKTRKKVVTKSGFKTKKDALAYLPQLYSQSNRERDITFQKLYETWFPTHKAGKSTMDCYKSAYKWFKPVHFMNISDIDIDDLQDCLDDCPKGKRTKENMKALCGLLYKYAIPRKYASLEMGHYLVIHAKGSEEKDALPMSEVEKLQKAIGTVPYADYIVAQCYLGFRPSELLALDAKCYDRKHRAFVGGAKTDAGKDRIVTISPKIQPIIDQLLRDKISGPVFCAPDHKPMSISAYREAFYNALDAVGTDNPMIGEGDNRRHKYTPHSCRHTFATLLKNVPAPDKDKLQLIGHTSTEMLRHYQDVNVEDLQKITDAI